MLDFYSVSFLYNFVFPFLSPKYFWFRYFSKTDVYQKMPSTIFSFKANFKNVSYLYGISIFILFFHVYSYFILTLKVCSKHLTKRNRKIFSKELEFEIHFIEISCTIKWNLILLKLCYFFMKYWIYTSEYQANFVLFV